MALGVADLITGSPLLKEVDFELPFGAATFRHVRTYAELPRIGTIEDSRVCAYDARGYATVGPVRPIDQMWDWGGQGWTIGQNPLFLFDAQYAGIVAMPGETGQLGGADYSPPRCYFSPDAHHSIPFELTNRSAEYPDYIAPPEYDAVLSYDHQGAVWVSGSSVSPGHWTTPPTTFYVWLNQSQVKYTIKLAAGDMPQMGSGNPASNRPTGYSDPNGYGLPRWGYVTRIEDRIGNYILQDYCETTRMYGSPLQPAHPDCETCIQNCNERGQLLRTRLFQAGSNENAPAWTIIYTYRPFDMRVATETIPDDIGNYGRAALRQNVLFATYVFRGNVELPSSLSGTPTCISETPNCHNGTPKCLTMPVDYFQVEHYLDRDSNSGNLMPITSGRLYQYIDAANTDGHIWDSDQIPLRTMMAMEYIDQVVDPLAEFGLPSNWVYHVRFLHCSDGAGLVSNFRWRASSTNNIPSVELGDIGYLKGFGSEHEAPRLVKATVHHRPASDSSNGERTTRRIYTYGSTKSSQCAAGDKSSLNRIFDDAAITAIENELRTQSNPTYQRPLLHGDYEFIYGISYSNVNYEFRVFNGHEYVEVKHLAPLSIANSGDVCDQDDDSDIPPSSSTPYSLRQELQNSIADLNASDIDPSNTFFVDCGIRSLVTRSANGATGGATRIYRFLNLPSGEADQSGDLQTLHGSDRTFPLEQQGFLRCLYHYPFRFVNFNIATNPAETAYKPGPTVPFWIVVIDDFKPGKTERADSVVYQADSLTGLERSSRRVLVMNRAGWVLREKTWWSDGRVLSSGSQAEVCRDSHGRVIERRSNGWGSDNNSSKSSQGLCEVFEYEGDSVQPARIGVRQGAGSSCGDTAAGTTYWTKAFEYGVSSHPELVTREAFFTQPIAGTINWSALTADQAQVVTHSYSFFAGNQTLRQRTSIRPAAPKSRGPGIEDHVAVTVEVSDEKGRLIHQGNGELRPSAFSSLDAASGDRFFWTTHQYEADSSRVTQTVVDAPSPSGAAYPRTAPTSVPFLGLTTSFDYDEDGVKRVTHPNGSIDYVLRRTDSTGRRQTLTYAGCVAAGSGSMECRGLVTIATAKDTGGATVSEDIKEYVCSGVVSAPPTGNESLTILTKTTPRYNIGGALTGITVEDPSDSNVSVGADLEYDQWGNVIREQTPNRSIVRREYNSLGQLERTYRGTDDHHEIWGTAAPVAGPCPSDTDYASNMVLSEKRSYGIGATDQGLLTIVRRYRSKVDNPFGLVIPLGLACTTPPPESNADFTGDVERVQYDLRMRPVWREQRSGASSSDALGGLIWAEAAFYDHANRVRFVASYGPAGLAGSPDPRTYPTTQDVPSVSDILQTNPLTLRETRYGPRGDIAEQLEYDVSDSSGATHLSSFMCYDRNGRVVWSQSPGRGVMTTEYDALGRMVSTSHSVAGDELERTDNAFDSVGNTIETSRWTRTASLPSGTITGSNGVRSRSFIWYDELNRVIATAELGTERTDETFQYSSSTTTRPSTIVRVFNSQNQLTGFTRPTSLANAIITATAYDNRGQVVGMIGPRGTATWNSYDNLGRLIVKAENATDTDKRKRPVTAYKYENGQLVAIAAVRNGMPNPVTNWSDNNTDLQITRVLYDGASVYYNDGTLATKSNDLPSAIRFSRAPCRADQDGDGSITVTDLFVFLNDWFNGCLGQSGSPCEGRTADFNQNDQIDTSDIFDYLNWWFAPPYDCHASADGGDLAFTYTLDDHIYTRENPHGAKFVYGYDGLRRLASIGVTGEGDYVGANAPVNAVSHVDYAYDDAGRLERSDAYAQASAGTSGRHVVASSLFTYDGLGRLTSEHMALGALATASSPATKYEWQTISPGSSSDQSASRLDQLTYPTPHRVGGVDVERKLGMVYGSSGSVDDVVSRLSALLDVNAGTTLAAFGYIGTDQRVSTNRGIPTSGTPAITQSFFDTGTTPALTNLDSFGRVKSLHYQGRNPGSTTNDLVVYRADHSYDFDGNRLEDSVTRSVAPGSGSVYGTATNTSWLHEYDKLDRLIKSKTGTRATTGTAIVADVDRTDYEWHLDELGNWGVRDSSGQYTSGYVIGGYDATGAEDPLKSKSDLYQANERNELAVVTRTRTTWDDVAQDYAVDETKLRFAYDRPGRLVYDLNAVHRYDAWGRLVALRAAVLSINDDGSINYNGSSAATAGRLAAHYTYDGLGRLIATQKPSSFDSGTGAVTSTTITRHLYDGARRIQDVTSSPIPVGEPVTMDPAFWPDPDGESGPATAASMAAAATFLLSREYIYDPAGDVDAHLAQYGYTYPAAPTSLNDLGTLLYVLQDVNLNVVALTDEQGVPTAQIGYTPYGQPTFFDNQQPGSAAGTVARGNPIGHQGLFFDRFDAYAASSAAVTLSGDASSLGYYHNRNRTYAPKLGRFIQRDPNRSGQSLEDMAASVDIPEADVWGVYADGMNLHAYACSQPIGRRDPRGTSAIPLPGAGSAAGDVIKGARDMATGARVIGILKGVLAATVGVVATGGVIWAEYYNAQHGRSTGMVMGGGNAEPAPNLVFYDTKYYSAASSDAFSDTLAEVSGESSRDEYEQARSDAQSGGGGSNNDDNNGQRGNRKVPTKAEAKANAENNGWQKVKDGPFNSHGQTVYKRDNKYLTIDVDSHNGGTYKLFDSKGKRLATLDFDFQPIGK